MPHRICYKGCNLGWHSSSCMATVPTSWYAASLTPAPERSCRLPCHSTYPSASNPVNNAFFELAWLRYLGLTRARVLRFPVMIDVVHACTTQTLSSTCARSAKPAAPIQCSDVLCCRKTQVNRRRGRTRPRPSRAKLLLHVSVDLWMPVYSCSACLAVPAFCSSRINPAH